MLIVVSGLRAEARMLRGPNVVEIAGGGDSPRLAADIDRAVADGGTRLLSFGIAGGLQPSLAPGAIVVPSFVVDPKGRFETDAASTARLRTALPGCDHGAVAGVDDAIADVRGKQALHAATRAVAVDMESHIAARAAARAKLPFAVVRVIADPAGRALPPAALAGMSRDGRTDIAAVLRALLRGPRQLPALVEVALDARRAMAVLAACARRISTG